MSHTYISMRKHETKSRSVINQIKASTDLPKVVALYLPLNKHLKARCPFHSDKTPSFSVHPNKQYWHCFGCGASGDVISFVQKFNKLSFSDAVVLLAAQVGVELPKSERFKVFMKRRFERVQDQLKKLKYIRGVLKEYEIERYSELRCELRQLIIKVDKNPTDYEQIYSIEHIQFDKLDEFIRKVENMLDEMEGEIRYGTKH